MAQKGRMQEPAARAALSCTNGYFGGLLCPKVIAMLVASLMR
jgi:hypothetical protein